MFAQLLWSTLVYLFFSSLVILATIWVFLRLTKYNDWEQIQQGNIAAALALGGKVFGVGNIMRFAITTNSSITDTLIWGAVGMVLMLLVYLMFEWLTPKININSEIGENANKAVGFMSLVFSVSFSFIIGASIT
ncbi:MAG: DUF350 domain-containing protein [Bacillota bacterium]